MKILEFQDKSKAAQAAKLLIAEALMNEPDITKDLIIIAKERNAILEGLENKFKAENTLIAKIAEAAKKRGITIEQSADSNNDTLRYSMIFVNNEYNQGYGRVLSDLEDKNYCVQKIWDAWANEGKPFDSGYRGINVTIISSQNQKFELQFHTIESFLFAKETHGLYEEKRNPKSSVKRRLEISAMMVKLASKINRPEGV